MIFKFFGGSRDGAIEDVEESNQPIIMILGRWLAKNEFEIDTEEELTDQQMIEMARDKSRERLFSVYYLDAVNSNPNVIIWRFYKSTIYGQIAITAAEARQLSMEKQDGR